jgi:hypothetical protein
MSTQIPPAGSAKKQTSIKDFKIEDGSTSVTGGETAEYNFIYQHKKIPAITFFNLQSAGTPHVNVWMDFVTRVGQYATGSLTIIGGTSTSNLNGDTMTLTNKDSIDQIFTFNNSDDVVTGGSIGLLSDGTTEEIANSIKTAINNVTSLNVAAGTITAVGGVDSDHTIELHQGITGSTGNTIIDVSSIGGDITAENFANGNNYGKVSFKANEGFTGSIKLRAISLQNDYLM